MQSLCKKYSPHCAHFGSFKKPSYAKITLVGLYWRFNWRGIYQLTCKYISRKLHKWKPHWWKPRNSGTRSTSNYSQLEKELHPIAGLTAWLELQLLENLFLSMPSKLSSLPDIMLRYSSYVLLWLWLCVFNFLSILSDFLSRERNGD